MSTSLGLTPEVVRYLAEVNPPEHPVLTQCRAETRSLPMAGMQISAEQGAFMALLARLTGAKRAFEVGVFTGYSSLAVMLAMQDVHGRDAYLLACDVSEEWTAKARSYWRAAGVDGQIDLKIAPAVETLDARIKAGESGSYDLGFIDADKPAYDAYYERGLQLLRTGGVMLFDNVLWSGRVADPGSTDESTTALRALAHNSRRCARACSHDGHWRWGFAGCEEISAPLRPPRGPDRVARERPRGTLQMTFTNTSSRYGWLTIVLHWIVAFGLIAMFVTGLQAGSAGEAGDRAARGALMGLHVSLGASLFAIFALRIVAYYAQLRPEKPPQARWLNTLSVAVHHLLLLGILIQIVSGPLAVWSGGRAINVFDLVQLPSPFAERNGAVHEGAEIGHLVGRAMIFFALVLHVLGAFKHLILDRDGVFSRMLRPGPLRVKS